MSEVVLKPCPFCGEVPEVARVASGYRGNADAATATFRVQCECCGIRFERQTEVAIDDDGKVKVLFDGHGEVIRLWNTRAKKQ